MPHTPEENHAAGSSKTAGKSTSGRPRKRARTDSNEEAPRAKNPKTSSHDKQEQLKQNLETAAVKTQDALAELQRTKDALRECKTRINNVIESLQDSKVMISTSTLVHNNIRTEERLERENAGLRERIKELEAAADDGWSGIDEVPLKARCTSPSSHMDDHMMENDSGDL
ncbi:hypothetical protein F5Y06DRAFT_298068 [Hypoxylon sp. FL0890]|nr:hypothetical protein F5Y06DRAFT_298068 [Hypoxylon sp. FL0890]